MKKSKMYLEWKFLSALLLMLLGTIKEIKCLDLCVNASLKTVSGFRLDDTVLQTKNVSSKIQCITTCVQDPCCRSLNYRDRSHFNEQSVCELLHNVIHNTTKELEEDSSHDHVFPIEPIKEYNATCFLKEIEVAVIGNTCAEIYKSGGREDGIYMINPDGLKPFQVKCLMTLGSGGLTVIQRRQDGSENFYRNWTDYKNGFGNLSGEFWLGLDKIHRLTNSGQTVLRIDMTARDDSGQFYAEYKKFFVSNESEQYKLDISGYSGNNYDAMPHHNGMKFYTKDKDNENNCVSIKKGGWWYNNCVTANPNGPYEENRNGLCWVKPGSNWGVKLYPKTFQMAVGPPSN